MNKLINITQLAKKLNLIEKKTKKPLNYTIRYWEKEFKQIKPKFINKHRYYDNKQIEIFKLINFLLKNKGMTIKGVKKILDSKINKLDYYNSHSLKKEYFKINITEKSKALIKKIDKLKKYGKKNSH